MKTLTLKMIPIATMVAALGVTPYAFAGDAVVISTAKNKQIIKELDTKKSKLDNTTEIESSLFSYGSGMANLNMGSGSGFLQNNSVALSSLLNDKSEDYVLAKAKSYQKLDDVDMKKTYATNVTSLKSYAFDHFGGLANVNIGTGTGFAQNNSVAISSVGH